jgi:hypothetical protein
VAVGVDNGIILKQHYSVKISPMQVETATIAARSRVQLAAIACTKDGMKSIGFSDSEKILGY